VLKPKAVHTSPKLPTASHSPLPRRVLTLSPGAVAAHQGSIDAAAEFAAWMLWFFVADRTRLLPYGAKSYSRDIFLVCFAALVAVAFGTGVRKEQRTMSLSRQQTEEWKGWMQVRLHGHAGVYARCLYCR
jgi:10 TM Acyl Transferase domain found in Cas1p